MVVANNSIHLKSNIVVIMTLTYIVLTELLL